MSRNYRVLSAITAATLLATTALYAGGDKNAHNNPNGRPTTDSFDVPFANYDDGGRMMIFCAEDELLVVVPAEKGALQVTCVPEPAS